MVVGVIDTVGPVSSKTPVNNNTTTTITAVSKSKIAITIQRRGLSHGEPVFFLDKGFPLVFGGGSVGFGTD